MTIGVDSMGLNLSSSTGLDSLSVNPEVKVGV